MIFLLFYRIVFCSLYLSVLPCLLALALILKLFKKENKFLQTLLLRWNAFQHLRKMPALSAHQKIYWFHAASGEIEYAKPVMRELKLRDPQCVVIWSYSSLSAQDFFSSVIDVDFKFPLPYDSVWGTKRLLQIIKPNVFLIARSDLWPELLNQLHRLKIPRLLFAATISPRKASRMVNQNIFSLLSHISCVSHDDIKHATQMHTSAVISMDGDPRADQVYYRARNTKTKFNFQPLLKNQNILLLGSTWPEDEQALKNVFQLSHWSFILVPHEWSQQKRQVYTEFFSSKTVGFLSEIQASEQLPPKHFDIIIVDFKGILADLYQHATAVFVGGSFKDKVHSVYEPLAWGKRVFVGPLYRNNREAIEFSQMQKHGQSFVTPIQNGDELYKIMQKLSPQHLADLTESIHQAIQKNLGASSLLANKIQEFITK